MKLLAVIILIMSILITGCSVQSSEDKNIDLDKQTYVRLAEDYDNWDTEAIGQLNFENIQKHTRVAVIDTGTNFIPEQVVETKNLIDNSNNIEDQNGHGTKILKKLLELNPFVEIIFIKIFNEEDQFSTQILEEAILYAIKSNADIIHMSLGTIHDSPEVKAAVDTAIDNGIIMVAAAGNDSYNAIYPGAYEDVFSVMARDINNWDLTLNSRSNDKQAFSAPGEHILCGDEYVTGSSIAATFITAAVSWYLSIDPNAQPNEIKQNLIKSCIYPNKYSYGIIQYDKLCNLLL